MEECISKNDTHTHTHTHNDEMSYGEVKEFSINKLNIERKCKHPLNYHIWSTSPPQTANRDLNPLN